MKKSNTSLLSFSLAFTVLSLMSLFISACSEQKSEDVQVEDPQVEQQDEGRGHGHGHGGEGDHAHGGTPHHGVVEVILSGRNASGFAELKLHDDKGDLELWLTSDKQGAHPLDLPLDTEITVSFSDLNDKKVTLRVRNSDKNEDEDGNGNIREGKTNYFIFPGDTGADASFLMGKEFVSKVVIFFSNGPSHNMTSEFELRPHTH